MSANDRLRSGRPDAGAAFACGCNTDVSAVTSVETAASGEEALSVLRELRPDLVILDWMMPGLDGAAVLRRMRADPATADIAVMVYTASADPEVARQAMTLGAMDCVPKVGWFADVRERIECCLHAGRLRLQADSPTLE